MNRTDVIARLEAERPILAERFGVSSLRLFGSFARDTGALASDVDLVVRFTGPATFRNYMDLLLHLEHVLGRTVDLVTEDAMRPELKPVVDKEAVHVA